MALPLCKRGPGGPIEPLRTIFRFLLNFLLLSQEKCFKEVNGHFLSLNPLNTLSILPVAKLLSIKGVVPDSPSGSHLYPLQPPQPPPQPTLHLLFGT